MLFDAHFKSNGDNNMSEPSTIKETSSPKPSTAQQERCRQDGKISVRERLKHFTFAWFLSTMSTGGLAIALAETSHRFTGLTQIGLAVFFLNIALFFLLCSLTLARCLFHPTHFKSSFTHPGESLFIGSFFLSLSVIVGGIQSYGVIHGPGYPWLLTTVHILYWMYAGISLLNSIFQYWILISRSVVRPCLSRRLLGNVDRYYCEFDCGITAGGEKNGDCS
ncbi:hypothetical protein NX059_002659 [Plenodomus lindquistii]|nr:hypothetical protein NX059_002659 [Plenodomus lindquistii]